MIIITIVVNYSDQEFGAKFIPEQVLEKNCSSDAKIVADLRRKPIWLFL
jgi:hypothetical protein